MAEGDPHQHGPGSEARSLRDIAQRLEEMQRELDARAPVDLAPSQPEDAPDLPPREMSE